MPKIILPKGSLNKNILYKPLKIATVASNSQMEANRLRREEISMFLDESAIAPNPNAQTENLPTDPEEEARMYFSSGVNYAPNTRQQHPDQT